MGIDKQVPATQESEVQLIPSSQVMGIVMQPPSAIEQKEGLQGSPLGQRALEGMLSHLPTAVLQVSTVQAMPSSHTALLGVNTQLPPTQESSVQLISSLQVMAVNTQPRMGSQEPVEQPSGGMQAASFGKLEQPKLPQVSTVQAMESSHSAS